MTANENAPDAGKIATLPGIHESRDAAKNDCDKESGTGKIKQHAQGMTNMWMPLLQPGIKPSDRVSRPARTAPPNCRNTMATMDNSTSSVTPSIGALKTKREKTSRLIIATSAKISTVPTLFSPVTKNRESATDDVSRLLHPATLGPSATRCADCRLG